jgi:arylsulfatase A-like enzyme/Tfp pilus assembly protein PilF
MKETVYFLKSILCWALIAVAFVSCNQPQEVNQARDLNVLLITLDTVRADHLSSYTPKKSGSRGAKTPHLDALAAGGVRFAHATAQVPLTLPSHACMLTGAYPAVHQLRDMGGFVLDPKCPTLATLAKDGGLLTAAFVSSKALSRHFGLLRGFDIYDDQMPFQNEEGNRIFPERRATVTTDHALDWLRQQGRQRFFLWVHFYDPHEPYEPPEPYKTMYSDDPYSGEIAYSDEQVGRIIDFLDQSELREQTLIVVISDHGEGLDDHGEATHGVFIYDDTLHVPLILSGPRVPAGRVIQEQVRSVDLLPTVAEFLGLPASPVAQGVSLWPLIEHGKPVAGRNAGYAYIETLYPKTFMNWSELRGMRTDRWKFILAPRPELYDLENDPAEKQNVIDRNPAEVDRLQKKIWEIVGSPKTDEKLAYAPVDSQTRQELAALGYVNPGSTRELILNTKGPDPKDRLGTLSAMRQYEQQMKKKSYTQAARTMETAVHNDPTNPLARLYLGKAQEKLSQWDRAIQTYRGAEEKGVATEQIFSRLGKAYLRVSDLDRAVSAMEKAAGMNPADLENLCNLGNSYLLLRKPDKAQNSFKAVLAQDDNHAGAYNGLGLAAVQLHDRGSALSNFQKAIELDPQNAEPFLHLGLLYQGSGEAQEAQRYLKLFLEKADPNRYGPLITQVRKSIDQPNSAK